MKNFKKQYAFAGVAFVIVALFLCATGFTGNKADERADIASSAINSEQVTIEPAFEEQYTHKNSELITESDSSTDTNTETVPSTMNTETVPSFTTDSTEEPTTSLIDYEKAINFDAEFPYFIKVNRAQNWTIVYGLDRNGYYSVPYKIFLCSTGLYEGYTPTGTFQIGEKYRWRLMVDGTYAQYAIRIHGQIMLHSVPYFSQNKNDLEVDEYNKLGSPASLGCVRFNVEGIKWIYDNCPAGTKVVIYDSEIEQPLLEIPTYTKAKSKGKKAGWDPTDPDKKNPWNKKSR